MDQVDGEARGTVTRVTDFDPHAEAAAITEAMRPLGTPRRAVQEKRYLKSDLEFLGVSVPDIRRTVTAALRSRHLDREAALVLALALWREPVHERRMAAVEMLRQSVRNLGPSDLGTVETLIREARGWALADGLAADVAGAIVLRHPEGWPRIDEWAGDGDFWIRRSALLALLPGVRGGQPDLGRFHQYADRMLAEKEFFIRKAIGWVLREISKRDPAWAVSWTGQHVQIMSGVTFREAVRRLPADRADQLREARARAVP